MRSIALFVWLFPLMQLAAAAGLEHADSAKQNLAEVVYKAEVAEAIHNLLKSKGAPLRTCNFMSFNVQCVKASLLPSDVRRILKTANRQARQILGGDAPKVRVDVNKYYSIVFAESQPERIQGELPDLFTPKQPGFVPFAAYDGHPHDWPEEGQTPENNFDNASVSGHKFSDLMSREDDYFQDDFLDFAYPNDVIQGERIVGFWERFADFSKSADLTGCSSGCKVAVRMTEPEIGSRSIAYCSVTYIGGIVGAPEDCSTIVVYAFGRVFLASILVFPNPLTGRDGEGGDEIACALKTSEEGRETPDSLAAQVLSSLQKLNDPSSFKNYGHDTKNREGAAEVIFANRYSVSAFFPRQFEISTIRVSISGKGGKDDPVKARVAATVTLSKTKSADQETYHLISSAEAAVVQRRLIELMPKAMECKVARGL